MRRFLLIFIILLISILFVNALEYNIPVSITVLPIYNLSIDINILNNKLFPGENLDVIIKLEKTDLTSISKEIAVDLNYKIIKGKKVIKTGFLQTINITSYKEEIINIKIPSDLRGRYILKIIASNPQSYSDKDSKMFVVRKKIMPGLPASFSFQNLINFLFPQTKLF